MAWFMYSRTDPQCVFGVGLNLSSHCFREALTILETKMWLFHNTGNVTCGFNWKFITKLIQSCQQMLKDKLAFDFTLDLLGCIANTENW